MPFLSMAYLIIVIIKFEMLKNILRILLLPLGAMKLELYIETTVRKQL